MTPQEIKQARQTLGLTQTQLAQALCVTVDSVRAWEAGRRNMSGPAEELLNRILTEKKK